MKAISLIDYKDAPYATWVAAGFKKIETRSRNMKYRGDLVICASNKSETAVAGHALGIVEVFHCEPMYKSHEHDARCYLYENAKSIFLRNWRIFDPIFPTKGLVTGGFQWLYDIEIPKDIKIVEKPEIEPAYDVIAEKSLFNQQQHENV